MNIEQLIFLFSYKFHTNFLMWEKPNHWTNKTANLSIYNKKSNCQFVPNLSPIYNKKKNHPIAQINLRRSIF